MSISKAHEIVSTGERQISEIKDFISSQDNLKEIIDAHNEIRKRPEKYKDMVDACTIYRTLGKKVYLVCGNRGNTKITTPEDVYTFKAYLQYKENEQTFGYGATNKIGSQYELIKG